MLEGKNAQSQSLTVIYEPMCDCLLGARINEL